MQQGGKRFFFPKKKREREGKRMRDRKSAREKRCFEIALLLDGKVVFFFILPFFYSLCQMRRPGGRSDGTVSFF